MTEGKTQDYVVQIATFVEQGDIATWEDIATVTVPSRTHRKTVIEKAAATQGGFFTEARQVRVIPAEHAEAIPVEMEQPPPQLRIG